MLAHVRALRQRALATACQERCLIGASLFRIGAGLTILSQYLSSYAQRHFLFGPDGLVPYDVFVQELRQNRSFSLYAFASSSLLFEVVFHLSILVTLLWVLGWHTRIMTLLSWICLWSLHARNPMLWDAGDNLVQIVLLYAIFANLGACWSIDAAHRRSQPCGGELARSAWALLHNAVVLAVALQLCLVYVTAGLAKVQGEMWQNGTALYYILRVDEFAWTGYGAAIWHNTVLLTLLTYAIVAFQLSFPFLLFAHRATCPLALLGGMSFHLGVALVMGLHTFAAFLISIELLLLPDSDYQGAVDTSQRLGCVLRIGAERLCRRLELYLRGYGWGNAGILRESGVGTDAPETSVSIPGSSTCCSSQSVPHSCMELVVTQPVDSELPPI